MTEEAYLLAVQQKRAQSTVIDRRYAFIQHTPQVV